MRLSPIRGDAAARLQVFQRPRYCHIAGCARYNQRVSSLARIAVVMTFALAYLSQPLALDACAVSCEAARAARAPAVAAPCHHTTSCATQISQPTSPGSNAIKAIPPPPLIAIELIELPMVVAAHPSHVVLVWTSPPLQLRT